MSIGDERPSAMLVYGVERTGANGGVYKTLVG